MIIKIITIIIKGQPLLKGILLNSRAFFSFFQKKEKKALLFSSGDTLAPTAVDKNYVED